MFTVEELSSKKKFEVLEIAKSLGVQRYKGKKELTKDEIISGIISKQAGNENNENAIEKDSSVSNKEIERVESVFIKENKVIKAVKDLEVKEAKKKMLSDEEREAKKKAYIEDAKVGVLVAFKTSDGKVKSAMIKKRSTKNRKFKVETKYGAEFIISFDDVLWVRTNKRWPKGVYQLLKGIDTEVTDNAKDDE